MQEKKVYITGKKKWQDLMLSLSNGAKTMKKKVEIFLAKKVVQKAAIFIW